jgi:trigger factor
MDDLMLDSKAPGLETSVEITESGSCAKSLTITVPAKAVDERLEMSIGSLAAEASVPGFRKGHVPRSILEKRFGGAMRHETRGQLLSDAFSSAVESNGLEVLGDPQFDESIALLELEAGKDFVFKVEVEVMPEFDLPDLEGVPVTKPEMEINDTHIEGELTRTRYRLGKPSTIEGPFELLDRMMGSIEVRLDDSEEVFFEHDQAVIVIPGEEDEGKGNVLGLLVDDLDKPLLGKKVGDVVEIETVGPESHEREEMRNAKVHMKYTIMAAERITPLEIAELVDAFSIDNEAGLREQVRDSLERRRDAEQRSAEREQVYEWLLEKISFETPPKMQAAQISRMIEARRMEFSSQGMEQDEIETRLAELRANSEESTKDRMRLFFILAKLAKHFEITVNDGELNGKIAEIAMSKGMRPEQLRAELTKNNQIRDVAMQIQEHKAADRIVDTANVTSMPAEKWNDLVDEKAAAKAGKSVKKTSKKTTKKKTTKKKTAKKSESKD